jgi:hypothetical protein
MYVKVESVSDTGGVAIRHPASCRGCPTDLNLCHQQNSPIFYISHNGHLLEVVSISMSCTYGDSPRARSQSPKRPSNMATR